MAENQNVQGNLNVSRNLHVGGHADVKGDLTVGHGLKAKGWLDAPLIKGAMKGLFPSVEALRKEYPEPLPGWFALVGDELPADLYRSEGKGWTATGKKGGISVDLGDIDGGSGGPGIDDNVISELAKSIIAEGYKRWLSKDRADRARGKIGFEAGAEFGDFTSGVSGAMIDSRGNAEFGSGLFRDFLMIYELIVNRQRVFDSDIMLTEGDTIESLTYQGMSSEGNRSYTLKMHEEWEGYRTALYEGDVLRGIFNDIEAGGSNDETCWLRVIAVRPEVNEVDAVMYPDGEVPGGRNFIPREMMKVARWGNSGEQEAQKRRQRLLYLSSSEGRIVGRMHVTKPGLDERNIAFSLGTVPEFLAKLDSRIKEGDQAIYVKTLIAQSVVTVDYNGLPEPEIVWRGEYDPDADYYDGTALAEYNMKYEKSCVLYYGCQWLCNRTGTKNPPSWDSTDWTVHQGDPRLRLEWVTAQDSVSVRDPQLTLEAIASIYNQDVTEDPNIRWDWERESIHNGERDTASDELWNAAHSGHGPRVDLTEPDFNYSFGTPPERLAFKVTATLYDRHGEPFKAPGTRSASRESMEIEV